MLNSKDNGSNCSTQDLQSDAVFRSKVGFRLGTAPPVTVCIRGPIKGYIQPHYIYFPTVTEGGQY